MTRVSVFYSEQDTTQRAYINGKNENDESEKEGRSHGKREKGKQVESGTVRVRVRATGLGYTGLGFVVKRNMWGVTPLPPPMFGLLHIYLMITPLTTPPVAHLWCNHYTPGCDF